MKINPKGIFDTTNEVYLPLYANTNRYLIIYGGAGSGKSRFVGQKILLRCLIEKGHRFLLVRKVATTIKKSMYQLMVDYIYKYNLGSLFKIIKSEMTIECINGNKILFVGLDDREKLKSIEGITSIWIEEASEITKEDFLQLDLRLRGYTPNYQQIILTFNPISQHNWIKKHFFDTKQEDTYILKTTYKDNIYIDDRYKKLLEDLKDTDNSYYNIYALGNWGVLKGRIFEPYIEIDTIPNNLPRVWGADFGTANPSAIVEIAYDEDKKALYLDEILYEAGLTRSELITKVSDIAPYLKAILGYGDSAEPATIKDFKKAGFMILEGIKETLLGIDFLKRHTIYITKRSYNLKEEWDEYKWKMDKDGNTLDIPIKVKDHAIDAVRYGAYSEWGVVRFTDGTTEDKARLQIKSYYDNITNSKFRGY